jgi:IS605 OrfB family transposase
VAEEYDHRTAVTRLEVEEDDRWLLEETIDHWRQGCQIATDLAWDSYDDKRGIQSLAYDYIRNRTNLGSQHAILATHQVAEAISTCLEQRRKEIQPSKPRFTAPTIRYDSRTMTLFDDDTVSLTTIENRIRCNLVLPDDPDGYQFTYLKNESWEVTESTLTVRDGSFFLHLGFRRPSVSEKASTAENGTVLGVDLGVENLVVTSTAKFFSGRELNHQRRKFEKRRGRLQKTGTRSSRRTLKQVGEREERYLRDYVHRVAKGTVAEARKYDCTTIVFEDLTDIRDAIPEANWFHVWAFRRVVQYVKYKAQDSGIETVQVGSEYTSQRCSRCSYTSEKNRQRRNHFRCENCGTEANADYNAAKNVGLRYVRGGQQSSRRTGASQCALKSGTLTPNGDFTPYPDGFEAEFSDKSLVDS